MKTINPILNTFITGDCEQVLKEIPSDSIDFVLTSPPYADKRDYGNENSSISPDEYVEWFLPKGREIYRVLKPTGSFILNISDKVVDGFQHLYVFELLLRLCKEVGFHLVRDYIWYNPATPPNVYSRGGYGRTKKSHEYCFWFSKGSDWTFELDPIRKPYSKDMQKYLDGKGKGARSENVRPSTHNFKLSNFVDLSGCEVLLLPTTGKSEIPFSLYAAETTSGVVLLNLAEANRIIASSIRSRRFAFLGKRERIRREISIDGYKCDLYIEDTDTIIEIKTILSLEKDGHFPTVHSIRSNKQLEELERLLDSGHKVCYLFVALCPKTKRLHLDFDNQYTSLFNSCIEKGMRYYGCGLKMSSNGFSVVSQLEVIPQ